MPLRLCVLASGSSGNATLVASETTRILVDAGIPAAEIALRLRTLGLEVTDIDGILLTHAHADHYRAAGTLQYRHKIPVFAPRATFEAIRQQRSSRRYRSITPPRDLPPSVGNIEISAFPVQHGHPDGLAGETIGYLFRHGTASAALATDIGTPTPGVRNALRNVNAIVVEANYDDATIERKLADPLYAMDWEYLAWVRSDFGHLSNHQCADLIAGSVTEATRDIFLAHLSENHHDPKKDNNSFELARTVVIARLRQEGLPLPNLHPTFRRGRTNGGPSIVVELAD